MKVSMESPEVKSGNTGQPRATREIPPLYIFSQAGTCPGVPGRNLRGTSTSSSREQRTRATPFAPGRHLFAPGAGTPTAAGSCRSTALGANRASTYSHPGRVLLQRSPHPLHSAGDDAAYATHHQPANMGGVGD